jgi:hypothetical protein
MPNLNPNFMLPYVWTSAWKAMSAHDDWIGLDELVSQLTPSGLVKDGKSRHVADCLRRLCTLEDVVEQEKGALRLADTVRDELEFRIAVGRGFLTRVEGDLFRKEAELLLANASQVGTAWMCLQGDSPPESFKDGSDRLLDEQFGPDRGFLRAQAPWDPLIWVMKWARFATVIYQGGTNRVLVEPSEYVLRALKTLDARGQVRMSTLRDHVAHEIPVLAEGEIGRRLASTAVKPLDEWVQGTGEGTWVSAPLHRALRRLEHRGILRIDYGDDSMDRVALLGSDGSSVMANSVILEAA